MARMLLSMVLLGMSSAAGAADDFKVTRLEQDVRDLQRQVRAQAGQIEALRAQLASPAVRPTPPSAAAGGTPASDTWVDATKWQRLRPGMNELEVIALLGVPTSMRTQDDGRVLLYAMEIGASGFLGGSVTLRDRVVVEVQQPALR